jgi:hypothetical protein
MFSNLDQMLYDFKNINTDDEKNSVGPWEGWYTFGRQRQIRNNKRQTDQDGLFKYVEEADTILKNVTNHYMNYYGMDQNNIIPTNGHLCEYSPVVNGDDRTVMTMTYHVDFQQEKLGRPGLFHYVTCNMYLNDDYKDGQICFSVGNDTFEYKPKAGDIIVFPSTPPYYHGVRKTLGSEKYFFRTFVMKSFDASKEWLDNQEKYGSEIWEEMEKEREVKERVGYIKHQDYQKPNKEVLNDK